MRTRFRVRASALVAPICLLLAGCPDASTSNNLSSAPESRTPEPAAKADASPAPTPPAAEAPAEPTMPEVVMSEAQKATCLKQVGDSLPDAALKTLDGKEKSLSAALGKDLSVVLFWSGQDADFATFLLEDMMSDVAKPYAGRGVQLVGVNVKDEEAQVQKVLDRAKVDFPTLRDEQGQLFEQVATEKLPRIYLVDGHGKILWFDIEYSRTTRRQLDQAIQIMLGGEKLASGGR